MQTITKYRANDGREFRTEEECRNHEVLLKSLKDLFSPLGERPKDDGCRFANGGGYIQHSLDVVSNIREDFHSYATSWLNQKDIDYINSDKWLEANNISERNQAIKEAQKQTYDKYFIGRYLDDSGSPLYFYWSRLQCIDTEGREWGQPYYANNPSKGDQKPYNE